MRFKAKSSKAQIAFLSSIISPLSRLSPTAFLKFDATKLRISARNKDSNDVMGFCEVRLDCLYSDYKISSLNDSQIMLELDLSHFRTSLLSIHSTLSHSDTCYIKLAKRNTQPCLCVETSTSSSSTLSHDLPCKILQVEEFMNCLPPKTSTPSVQVYLPSPSNPTIRTCIERLKSLGRRETDHIFVEGSTSGWLSFTGMVTGACSKATFEDLNVEFSDSKASEAYRVDQLQMSQGCGNDDDLSVQVKVQNKKLLEIFKWQVSMQKWVDESTLCIVEDEMVIIHVILPRFNGDGGEEEETGFCTFYCPTVAFDPDDEME
ncbi:hypothetical protein TrVE_jg8934 [Triparma verrucosa]|uniref:Checkpoint protein n=1 Tax=Triparma verrucosa TaxID=1606542 RepID=A0A9W6Z8L2_9STRA|nr:hypothetical protein TrVE_jg8934 [Triparma verrucosa]